MFEQLGDRLDGVFRRLKGRGVITQPMLREGLREVRRALLEADVNFHVARDFLKRVEERALGEKALESVRPADQVVKIVHDELIEVLGGASAESELAEAAVPPSVIMLVGLQGSGKTTTAGKLARRFDRLGRRPTLVACDPYRPAAGEQLVTLAESIGVPVVHEPEQKDVVALAAGAVDTARRAGATHVIIDTAGRLQADVELMDELKRLRTKIAPQEVLLVADGMTGQEAVRIAQGFHETVGITGVVLTKMDGDARGGAALSIHGVLGVPVKFVGVGEHLEDLTAFEPERMAGRILQMGDIVGLVEKAQQTFDLEDFLQATKQIQKMGPIEGLLKMIPGVKPKMLEGVDLDPRRIRHMEAIILSMTPAERRKPEIMNGSRRARVAKGSGRPVHEVNRLLKQFKEMRKMMKQMGQLAPRLAAGGKMGSLLQ
jgi:signal recognition particle subunit SRP54